MSKKPNRAKRRKEPHSQIFILINSNNTPDEEVLARLMSHPVDLAELDVMKRSVFSAAAFNQKKSLLENLVRIYSNSPSLMRHDTDGLPFLAHVANLDDPYLYSKVIQHLSQMNRTKLRQKQTKDEVSLATHIMESNLESKYELIRITLDCDHGLGYVLHVRERSVFIYSFITKLALDEETDFELINSPTEDDLKAIIKYATTSGKASLDFRDRQGRNLVAWACENGQDKILPYLEVTSEKVNEEENMHNFNSLLICCGDNFQALQTKSRRPCMEFLLNIPGVEFDRPSSSLKVTPLFYTVAYGSFSESQREIAQFLAEKGADMFWENEDGFSCLYFAIYSNAVGLVTHALKTKQFDLTKRLNKTKRTPLAFLCNCFLYTFLTEEQMDRGQEPDLQLIRLFCQQGAPTVQAMFYLCLNITARFAPQLFLELINQGAEIDYPSINHMTLLMNCAVAGNYACFKILLEHQAYLHYNFIPRVCLNENSNIHRWISYEKLEDYFVANDVPLESTYVCHICFTKIKLFEGVTVCEDGETCDCRICSKCGVFSVPKTGVNLLQFTANIKKPKFSNATKSVICTEVGKSLYKNNLMTHLTILREAKLDKAILLKQFTRNEFRRLGIISLKDQNTLSQLFC